ncbi:MAG: tetratricopeptide repeat protein [Syntrophobacter sp.]
MGAKKAKPTAKPAAKPAAKPVTKPVVKPVVKKSQGKPIILQDTYLEQVKLWADKHYPLLVGITAAILFTMISTWGIRTYDAHKENTARAAYAVVALKLPAEGTATPDDWQKLVPELQKIISDHKGTQPALMARMELARAYLETKRYDEAVKTAIEAMKYLPPGHSLRPLLQYQLACTYEAAGNREQAAKEWAQLKESGTAGLQREAEWNLGRNFAAKNDFAKAAESYQKASETPGSYPSPTMLDQELARARQAAGIAEKPTAGAGEKPQTGPGDKSVAEKPAPASAEKPAAATGEKPAAGTVEKPQAGSGDKPAAGKPAPGSAEKPAAATGEKPAAGAVEKPQAGPGDKPAAGKPAPGSAAKPPAGTGKKPAAGAAEKK